VNASNTSNNRWVNMVRHAIGRRVHREDYLLHDRSERTVLLQAGLFSLKVFHPLTESRVQVEGETLTVAPIRQPTPLLLVPPLGVYLVDWGQPSAAESHLTLQDYALDWLPKAVAAVQTHSGQPQVSLLGYCMGGLLALMYTAAQGEAHVRNIITIASPINMHQMSGPVGRLYQMLSGPSGVVKRLTGHELSLLDAERFHIDGRVLSILFRLSQPKATVTSYLELVRHLADKQYVSRYMTMNEWFSHMPDYPGATIQEMVQRLGLANGMANGCFKVGQTVVDFAKIRCPLLAFAGANDAITSISSASALLSVVGSTDLSFEVVAGGHAGVFTGSGAVQTTWAIAADWLSLRSGAIQTEAQS
jgi:polyhydroxyalkanoate synthase